MRIPLRAHVFVLCFVGCFVVSIDSSSAATAVIVSSKDTSIFSESNNTAGGNDVVYVGRNSTSTRRALLQFDIAGSGIPAGSTINSAMLTLYLNAFSGTTFGADRTVSVYRVTSPWGSGTTGSGGSGGAGGMGSAAAAGDVTWNYSAYNTTSWSAAGGDLAAAASDALLISNSPNPVTLNSPFSWTGSGLAADVQAWLDGAQPNDGWLLHDGEATNQSLLRFYSRDVVDNATTTTVDESTFRPVLTVTYTAIPEPQSWLLLALGASIVGLVGIRTRDKARG